MTPLLRKSGPMDGFQSTHLHEVWLKLPMMYVKTQGFNPHTYMRCDYDVSFLTKYFTVSIHTPTWGVTMELRFCVLLVLFQSTHLHEVWPTRVNGITTEANSFNPHTYMRCDVQMHDYLLTLRVSIHTPTWGVTTRWSTSTIAWMFQSTHLHEVWLISR